MNPDLNNIERVYFLGIGGIGMSALARFFLAKGLQVAGYDLTSSSITDSLSELGAQIHFEDRVDLIPDEFIRRAECLIVRTPAVPDDHQELNHFRKNKYRIVKRAELLGLLFNQSEGIAVAGTHGKTSVSSMTAYILSCSHVGCNAFLGGILKNTNSNLIINTNTSWTVAEADEFDRSFLQLHPAIALITWVDADHLDIYGSAGEIEKAFTAFAGQVREGGTLILKKGIRLDIPRQNIKNLSYASDDPAADYFALDLRNEGQRYTFNIRTPGGMIRDIRLRIPGITNVENAVAAAALSHCAGASPEEIGRALSDFTGVRRRFDVQVENERVVYIDDYAHHPRELDAVIGSVRKLYTDRKITAIFQPHLYSRTRDFAAEFAESLSRLDALLLMEIYPAREKPVPGVDASMILDRVTAPEKKMVRKQDILQELASRQIDVLLTLGAGDIDKWVEPIRKLVETR